MAQQMEADGTVDVSKIIQSGWLDIAERGDLAKMRVQAPGRRTFQKVWIWRSSNQADDDQESGGAKTDVFKVEVYGPKSENWEPVSPLPTQEELKAHGNAQEMLEVGLIDAANLEIMMISEVDGTTARNKEVEKQRKEGGPLDRPPHALRVFAPISAKIEDQKKYVVGCSSQGGRVHGKRIKKDYIFFYHEFWELVEKKILGRMMNVSERKKAIGPVIAELTAREKVKEGQVTVEITADAASKWTSSSPLAVTQAENLAATVRLHWSVGRLTGEMEHIDAAIARMEGAVPALRDGPWRVDYGVKAFLVFDEELTEEEANQLSNELKGTHQHMAKIDPAFILQVHEVLRENTAASDQVSASLLPILLGVYADKGAGLTTSDLRSILLDVLRTTTLFSKLIPTTSYTTSDAQPNGKQLVHILASIQALVKQTAKKLYDDGIAIIQQHGGISSHDSLDDLMEKAAKAVDVKTQQAFLHLVAALNASQFGVSQRTAAESLRELAATVERALKFVAKNETIGEDGEKESE